MTKTNPLVSIIVDSFNYDRFIERAIESALAQTYKNIEVIVVDDGSSDRSAQVITAFGNRIRAIFKENGGQASALNTGFAASKGDLILFVDSDDALATDCVERAVKAWRPEFSKLHYPLTIIDSAGNPTGHLKPPLRLLPNDALKTTKQVGSYICPPTTGNIFARTYLSLILPMPELDWRTHPDAYLCALAPLFGEVGTIREPLGFYRVHGSNNHILVDEHGIRTKKLHEDIHRNMLIGKLVTSFCAKQAITLNVPAYQGYPQLKARLVSRILTRDNHPVPKDTVVKLALLAILRVWQDSEARPRKKVTFSVWVLAVSIIPRKLVKPIINMAY